MDYLFCFDISHNISYIIPLMHEEIHPSRKRYIYQNCLPTFSCRNSNFNQSKFQWRWFFTWLPALPPSEMAGGGVLYLRPNIFVNGSYPLAMTKETNPKEPNHK